MSFLLHETPHLSVRSAGPLIRARDAHKIGDAATLLDEASAIRARADADAATIRAAARSEGLAAGVAAVRSELADALAAMADMLAAQQRQRDADLADAALAAVRAILGAAGPAVIGPALVEQALESFVDGGAVTVEVAPALAEALRARLEADPLITVVADPALEPLDCNLRLSRGTIAAGLSVQLDALAERWRGPE